MLIKSEPRDYTITYMDASGNDASCIVFATSELRALTLFIALMADRGELWSHARFD